MPKRATADPIDDALPLLEGYIEDDNVSKAQAWKALTAVKLRLDQQVKAMEKRSKQ